nr:sex-determining region Y protein-like [Crassostrea gigas]
MAGAGFIIGIGHVAVICIWKAKAAIVGEQRHQHAVVEEQQQRHQHAVVEEQQQHHQHAVVEEQQQHHHHAVVEEQQQHHHHAVVEEQQQHHHHAVVEEQQQHHHHAVVEEQHHHAVVEEQQHHHHAVVEEQHHHAVVEEQQHHHYAEEEQHLRHTLHLVQDLIYLMRSREEVLIPDMTQDIAVLRAPDKSRETEHCPYHNDGLLQQKSTEQMPNVSDVPHRITFYSVYNIFVVKI